MYQCIYADHKLVHKVGLIDLLFNFGTQFKCTAVEV